MTPDDFRYCIELDLRPGVTVAVIAPVHSSLEEIVKLVGGPKAKLDKGAVQEVRIARRGPEQTRRFVSRAVRPNVSTEAE